MEERTDGTNRSLVVAEPAGVVAAITPWNGPMSTPVIKIAPALIAGCSVVAKPAPDAPLSTIALADALADAGLPDGVFTWSPGTGLPASISSCTLRWTKLRSLAARPPASESCRSAPTAWPGSGSS